MSAPFCACCVDETVGLTVSSRPGKPDVLLCFRCRDPLAELKQCATEEKDHGKTGKGKRGVATKGTVTR